MTSLDKALLLSKSLKDEANKLLVVTGLNELLNIFGSAELVGSYNYDLLVDRDLDFSVVVKEMSPQLRSEIVATFAKQPWAYSVNMTDRINFEPLSNLQAPRGLYLGLTIPFPQERWNVDIWFTVDKVTPSDQLVEKIIKATLEQKNSMLQIKYELMMNGQKQKGVSSALVYDAVLEKGVKTTSDFLESIVS